MSAAKMARMVQQKWQEWCSIFGNKECSIIGNNIILPKYWTTA
jgi:hypothetical protein